MAKIRCNMKWTYLLPLCLLISNTFALGTKTLDGATRAQSMGGAFTAVSDDPSAVFYNPSGLTQINDMGVNFNLYPIFPNISYTNAYNGASAFSKIPALGTSVFFAKRLNEHIVFGIDIVAPFARKLDYFRSRALYGFPVEAEIIDMNLTPVVAIKVNEKLSFGAGPTLNYDYVKATIVGLKQKAGGFSGSGVLSALYKISDLWKFGATYHLQSTFNISGEGYSKGSFFLPPSFHQPFTLKFKNPAYLSLGLAGQVTPKLLLAADYELLFWNQVKSFNAIYKNPIFNNTTILNARNSSNLHFGLEYAFRDNQKFRLGYVYIQQSFPSEAVNPVTIDFNGNEYTAGYSYLYNLPCNQSWRFDLGYAFDTTRNTYNNSPTYNLFQGKYHANVSTISLGINYQV